MAEFMLCLNVGLVIGAACGGAVVALVAVSPWGMDIIRALIPSKS